MSATDFNLSAAISLQLATGAGAKLTKEITDVLNGAIKDMKPTITPVLGTMSAQLQRIFPKVKTTATEVTVNLKVGKAQGTAELKELLTNKTLKIDVEFSDKAKKAIDDFSTSLSKLRESSKGFEELQKLVKYMNTIGKTDLESLAGGASSKAKAKADKAKQAYEDLIAKFKELGKKASVGEFVPFSLERFKELEKRFRTVSNAASRFGGINGQTAKNVKFALDAVFSSYKDLEREQRKATKSGLIKADPNLEKEFKKAKVELLKVFNTLDAAEQIPLAATIKDVVKPVRDLVSEANKYRKLIREINKEGIEAKATGASKESINLIKERLKLTKEARKKSVSTGDFLESDDYVNLVARAKNFTQVERSAFKAANSVKRYQNEVNLSSDFKTQGAVESGSTKKVEKLLADFEALYTAEAKIGKSNSVQIITQELDKLKLSVSAVKDEATAFDAVLKSFDDKKAFFDNRGLKESAKLTEENKQKLIKAQQATGGISTSSTIFQQINQSTEAFAENEKKIYKFVLAIDKLKAALQFSIGGGQDFAGVGDDIQKLESRISGMINNFDERKVKETLTSDSYKIRAKDKLNKVINSSFDSFDQAIVDTAGAGAGIRKIGPQVFKDGRADLDKFISGLNLVSDSYADISKNISLVKAKADKLFALATIKAEGGFIGAITKSLGLAAKRLTTFLFAARAIYGVQNAIIDATTSAVELDTEFTRLEQIFAGSQDRIGSVEKNVASLSGQILTLAKNYGVAATEIAKSADIFAQAGIQGRSLEKILEISTKARLGPTFGSNIEISEAIIASMNQFKIKADEMEDVIGGISQVSAQFAVESDGITKAIRRAGGSFAAAKADGQSYMSALADFVGAFTVLKEQTREADETLATSLRNVLNRLQRSNVRKYLQDNFNINLLDANNQFIGFSEAIARVANRIKELGIKSGDPRFAELVQKLAGSLQSSRLTSLLAGAGDISKAVAEFQKGGESLNRDTDIAFGSLENKLGRAKNAVVELFTEIARSDAVKALVELFTILTQTITGALRAISGLNAAILITGAALAGIKSIGSISNIVVKGIAGLSQSGLLGPGKGFNTGGLVPGIGPNVDTEPYMLTKGEYVINRNSVSKYGKSFFNDLNSGKINYAATGSGPNGMISNSDSRSLYSGVLGLVKLFKDLGVEIFGLTNILADFEISPDLVEKENARGIYEFNTKNPVGTGKIRLDQNKGVNLQTASHEVGHAIQETARKKYQIVPSIPQNILEESNKRISKGGYSDKFHTVDQENFADTFAATIQDLVGAKPDPANAGFFKGFLSQIKTTLGLSVQPVGADTRYQRLSPDRPPRKPQQVVDQSKDFIDSLSPEMNKILTVLSSNKDNPVISGDPILPQRAKKQTGEKYSSAMGDAIDSVTSIFKGLANSIKSGLGILRDAADSAMPLSGLERFNNNPTVVTGDPINIPQIQNPSRKSARKQPKVRISEREFEREFIRFNPVGPQNYEKGVKQGPPTPTRRQREAVKRNGYGAPGRYQFDGVNPPLPSGGIEPPPFVPGKEKVKIDNQYSGAVSFETLDLMNKRRKDNQRAKREAAQRKEQAQYEKEQAFFDAIAPPVNPPSKPPSGAGFGGMGYPTPPSGPRNPDPPNGSKPPGGGGNNPPPNGPNTPVTRGSFFDVNKLTILGGALTAATVALSFYASSSKDASDKVKVLMDAVIAATTAVTAYTIATNGATMASTFLSKFGTKASVNGVTENVTDLAKGFGGGGFFDKYGKGGSPLSGAGGPVGRFGRVVNGVKGATGFLNNGATKLAGQAGAKLATYVPTFAKLGSAALTAAKFLGPQVLGAVVVGLVAALGSFNDAAIKASEEVIAKSTSEREVIEERANIEKRQRTSRGLGVLGKVAGGAALGATVGGPVGAAVGAIGGFFLGILTQFKDGKIGTIVTRLLKSAGEWIGAIADAIGNGIGWVADKIDNAFNAAASVVGLGVSEADINKKKEFQANIDKGGANINSFNRGFKRKGGATNEEFDNLFKAVQQTSNATSGYKSLSDEDKTKAKGQAERLKSALDGVNAFQRGTIIDKAKKSGIDIANMFDQLGLEFDQVGPAAAIASDKLSKMFANMQSVSDRVGGAISNFNTGNDIISSRAAGIAGEGTAGGVSAGVFENLRRGAAPSGLAAEETNKLFKDLESFSPAAALNARVEAGGTRAAFDVKNQLAGKDIKIDAGNTGDQVGNLIGDMFDKSLQGQPKEVRQRLNDMLDTYLDSQQEALNGVVGADNTVNNEKVGEVISGFTESIKRGGLDTAEAFNGANQQFKQAMDGIIKRRIEYENKITALGRQGVDRQKSFIEFQNKAAGKPDTAINLAQAKGLDAQRQAILLRGSGLGGNASVADIRGRYDQLTAQDPSGKDPAIQALKDNLYTALEGIASGTDSFTTAIREFDKASEQAKRRTEELSNALLGTDENLFNTLKGINLEQRVLGAGDKGQAFLALQNADDASRQALTQRLASDPERKKQFEAKLGLGSNISASREAQNVAAEFGNQQAAGDAMIGVNQKLADNMTGLVGELTKNREAFNTFGLQINNFANAANNLANNLGNIPQNIAHAHTFKVDPIQISFTGAEALAALDGPMKGVITEIVNARISSFAENLKSKNKGLTVDNLTGNTGVA